jgi:hypothetical protein
MFELTACLQSLHLEYLRVLWCAIMLSAAESVSKDTSGAWRPAARVEVEANQDVLRSALSDAERKAAQTKRQVMTLGLALAFVSEYL